jgi:hypothetical protein
MAPRGGAVAIKEARAARRRERGRREGSKARRPPFLPPTGHFDNGDYAGVQLHVEDEVRVNNYEAMMLEKARQVTTTVDQNVQRRPRCRLARSGGAALMDCSLHFGGSEQRAWANVKPEDESKTPDEPRAAATQWTVDEVAAHRKLLSRLYLLQPLSGEQLHEVAEVLEYREYWAGEAIIQHGDPGDGVYVMLSGAARAETKDGAFLTAYGPNSIFGELALESDQPRGATVRAIAAAAASSESGGDEDDYSDRPDAVLLKIPHTMCRLLRGNVGLRARLAKIRRGFERPRSQYQGVQGSHMTLSEQTPGAFGASDAGTALRSIGVPEVDAEERAAQLEKQLERGKGHLRAEQELGIRERLTEAHAERVRDQTLQLGTRGSASVSQAAAAAAPRRRHHRRRRRRRRMQRVLPRRSSSGCGRWRRSGGSVLSTCERWTASRLKAAAAAAAAGGTWRAGFTQRVQGGGC